jgi:D-galactarolactone cycloisomerase
MQAISGIEIALWDLRGKQTGRSIAALLGQERDTIPIYASGMLSFHHSPDEYVATLEPALDRGVTTVKIRTGKDLDWDRHWVSAIRDRLPGTIDLLVDGKYDYTPDSAVELAATLADLGVLAFEEPILDDDLDAVGQAASRARVPFAYGEHAFGVHDFRELISHGAAAILEPNVTICGGLAEARRLAQLAKSANHQLMPHCGGLSAVGVAANIHLLASLGDTLPLEYDIRAHQPLRDEITSSGPSFDLDQVHQGLLTVPAGPGLGIDVDRAALDRYPYEIDSAIAATPTEYAFPHI